MSFNVNIARVWIAITTVAAIALAAGCNVGDSTAPSQESINGKEIRADRFEGHVLQNDRTLTVSLDTDLPDDAQVFLKVWRNWTASGIDGNPIDQGTSYVDEETTAGKLHMPRDVPIDDSIVDKAIRKSVMLGQHFHSLSPKVRVEFFTKCYPKLAGSAVLPCDVDLPGQQVQFESAIDVPVPFAWPNSTFGSTDAANAVVSKKVVGNQPVDVAGPEAVTAYTMCKHFTEQRLKAPSTATWPWRYDDVTSDLGGGIFRVQTYVDAQNGFGAMIRSNVDCTVKFIENGRWHLENLQID